MSDKSSEQTPRFAERHPKLFRVFILLLVGLLSLYEWYLEKFHTCGGCGQTKTSLVPGGRVCMNPECPKSNFHVTNEERIR